MPVYPFENISRRNLYFIVNGTWTIILYSELCAPLLNLLIVLLGRLKEKIRSLQCIIPFVTIWMTWWSHMTSKGCMWMQMRGSMRSRSLISRLDIRVLRGFTKREKVLSLFRYCFLWIGYRVTRRYHRAAKFVSFAIRIERIEVWDLYYAGILQFFNVLFENGLILMLKMVQMVENWSKNRIRTKGGGTRPTTDLKSAENSDLPSILKRVPPPCRLINP